MTESQRRIFIAAADRVLPGVEGPGATEARAVDYLERLWREPMFRTAEKSFSDGLALLDDLARGLFGQGFADCPAEQRDAVLRKLEAIPHPTARRFLVSLVRVTLSGTFCHPIHGGNHEAVSWRALGIDYPRQPAWQDETI